MNSKYILVLAVVILAAVHQSSATFSLCGCKEKGIDVCSCKKGLTAPRPYPITLPKLQAPVFKSICKERGPAPPQPFQPIGDECNCGKQIVKPAPLTKPPCPHQKQWQLPSWPKPPCNCNHKPDVPSDNCGDVIPAPPAPPAPPCQKCQGHAIYYETSKKKSTSSSRPRNVPADAVSIAIAKRLASSARNGISEKHLQYGSLKVPTIEEKTDVKTSKNVNEENFYNTNGNVLQLHPTVFNPQESSESSESSEEQKPKKPSAFNPASLGFEEIGYQPYQPQKARYVIVKNSQPLSHDCPKAQRKSKHHHHRQTEKPCNCYQDLVVEQSAISEQSVSADSSGSSYDSSNQSFAT